MSADDDDRKPSEARVFANVFDQLREVSLREAMQEVFDRWQITPHTIVYEDFIARYEQTPRDVLAFLEVPSHESLAIPSPSFAPIADDIAERWYARYCAEHPLP